MDTQSTDSRELERRVETRRGRGSDSQTIDAAVTMANDTLAFREAKARAIATFESAYLRTLLRRTEGNVSLAARLAGKERSRFNRLVRKHRIVARDFRPASKRGIDATESNA